MSDLDIIKAIEKELGVELKQVDELKWGTKGYVLNKNRRVTAVGLHDSGAEDLQQLSKLLAGLTGLQVLWLAGNKISELGPLEKLTGLQRLSLDSN